MSTYFDPTHGIKGSFDVGDREAEHRYMVRFNTRNEGRRRNDFRCQSTSELKAAVNKTISWLGASQEVPKEEYEEEPNKLEGIANIRCSRRNW
ncbi:Hsp70 chaperone [Stygiomarasmius scandens]|uniref:Hsp70 chaperone n=1 Tax=Marasmiellus scandens TaxID=2682957 RepID=A0ABR1J5L9_9AGAR